MASRQKIEREVNALWRAQQGLTGETLTPAQRGELQSAIELKVKEVEALEAQAPPGTNGGSMIQPVGVAGLPTFNPPDHIDPTVVDNLGKYGETFRKHVQRQARNQVTGEPLFSDKGPVMEVIEADVHTEQKGPAIGFEQAKLLGRQNYHRRKGDEEHYTTVVMSSAGNRRFIVDRPTMEKLVDHWHSAT